LPAEHEKELDQQWWKKHAETLRNGVIVIVVGWFGLQLVAMVIGWIVRGFLGIPYLDFADLGRIAGDTDQAVEEPFGIFCALPVIG
jgi:hypothetical protein